MLGMVAGYLLLSALRSAGQQLEQDKKTSDALAQAKAALIGRAATDDNSPGSFPCPDSNNDGIAELLAGSSCSNYVGRLPYKTLGLPDLRDSAGERLWYALSPNFVDAGGVQINSDSTGQLTVTGATPATGVIAIVFAPGAPLGSQTRDGAGATAVSNYLDGKNAVDRPPGGANWDFESRAGSAIFNDRLLIISHDDLFPVVQKRIAREAKKCLDAYASSHGGKYPWAAPNTPIGYVGAANTYFGRIPDDLGGGNLKADLQAAVDALTAARAALQGASGSAAKAAAAQALSVAAANLQTVANGVRTGSVQITTAANSAISAASAAARAANTARRRLTQPSINNAITTADNAITAANNLVAAVPDSGIDLSVTRLQDSISSMGSALAAFQANPSSSTARSLQTAASNLQNVATSVRTQSSQISTAARVTATSASAAQAAASEAASDPTRHNVADAIRAATSAIRNANRLLNRLPSSSGPAAGGCAATYPYWPVWKPFVFFQMDRNYAPSGAGGGIASLTVNGRGPYKVVTVVADRALAGQNRPPEDVRNYLEAGNADGSRNAPATTPVATFVHDAVSADFNDQLAW
jgi:hypothetical protein